MISCQVNYLPTFVSYLNSENYLQRYGAFGDQYYIDDLPLDDSSQEQNKSTKRRRITVH